MESEFNRKLTLLFCIFRQPDVRRSRKIERVRKRKRKTENGISVYSKTIAKYGTPNESLHFFNP